MKNLLRKALFISLLLSAAMPSNVQAGSSFAVAERAAGPRANIISVAVAMVIEAALRAARAAPELAVVERATVAQGALVKVVILGAFIMTGVVLPVVKVVPKLAVVAKSVEKAAIAAGEMMKAAKIKEAV